MEQKKHALEIIQGIVGNQEIAAKILQSLQDEGLVQVSYGNQDVEMIIRTFAELFGSTKTTRYDRWAAARMAKSSVHGGSQGIVAVMRLYHSFQGDKYAPSASSVAQFEEKLPAIVAFLRKKGQQSGEILL